MPWRRLALALATLVSPYAFGAEDPACRTIRLEVETSGPQSLAAGGPERQLGTLCGYENVPCAGLPHHISLDALEKRGVPLRSSETQHILKERAVIEVSEIDVNNDLLPDIRLTRIVGSARCQRNYFFIQGANDRHVYKRFGEFDPLTTEGGFCYDASLIVRRVENVNYLVAIGQPTVVFRGARDGALSQVCSFEPQERWTEEQTRIADLVRERFPQMPQEVNILRPELERIDFSNHEPFAKKGEMVWSVVAQCAGSEQAYAIILVHPHRKDFEVVIEPGGASSRCN